jgi:hypothetical protein
MWWSWLALAAEDRKCKENRCVLLDVHLHALKKSPTTASLNKAVLKSIFSSWLLLAAKSLLMQVLYQRHYPIEEKSDFTYATRENCPFY